jgi:hypothetical protein
MRYAHVLVSSQKCEIDPQPQVDSDEPVLCAMKRTTGSTCQVHEKCDLPTPSEARLPRNIARPDASRCLAFSSLVLLPSCYCFYSCVPCRIVCHVLARFAPVDISPYFDRRASVVSRRFEIVSENTSLSGVPRVSRNHPPNIHRDMAAIESQVCSPAQKRDSIDPGRLRNNRSQSSESIQEGVDRSQRPTPRKG